MTKDLTSLKVVDLTLWLALSTVLCRKSEESIDLNMKEGISK